ncbi:hypothetical protein C1S80_12920 [Mycolicibacterium aubagnense]|nr:hypothetical protein C1S80_12920 [Mycolicibacterium aubagnense]
MSEDDDLVLHTERPCANCGDECLTLSSREWCDGCEEEADHAASTPATATRPLANLLGDVTRP